MKIITILLLIITTQAFAEEEIVDDELIAFACGKYGEQARIILSERYEGKTKEEQLEVYSEDIPIVYEDEEVSLITEYLIGIVNAAYDEKLVKIFNQRRKFHLNSFEKKQIRGCKEYFENPDIVSDVEFCGEYGKEARNALDRRYRGATLAEVLQHYEEEEICMTEGWNKKYNCLTKEALTFITKKAFEQYLTIDVASYVAKEKNEFENWAIKNCLSDMEEYDTNPDSDSWGLSMEQCNSRIEFGRKTLEDAMAGVGISDYLNSYGRELTKKESCNPPINNLYQK